MSLFSNKTSTASLISEARKAETVKGKTSVRPKVMSVINAYLISKISHISYLLSGPHTNRFFHAKRPVDVWRERGVKAPDVFKIFVSSIFLPRSFCKELYSTAFVCSVFFSINFNSIESFLSVFVALGHGKHVTDGFIIT